MPSIHLHLKLLPVELHGANGISSLTIFPFSHHQLLQSLFLSCLSPCQCLRPERQQTKHRSTLLSSSLLSQRPLRHPRTPPINSTPRNGSTSRTQAPSQSTSDRQCASCNESRAESGLASRAGQPLRGPRLESGSREGECLAGRKEPLIDHPALRLSCTRGNK